MEFIERKEVTRLYGVSPQSISWRIRAGYYKTNEDGRLIVLDDVFACLENPPKSGTKPKIKKE